MSWQREAHSEKEAGFKEWVLREYPCCDHLRPIERYLASHGIELEHDLGYYGIVTIEVKARLDLDSIEKRLRLESCVKQMEIDDERDGTNIRGFLCAIDKHQIRGEENRDCPTIG
jgi:hypothetical protein